MVLNIRFGTRPLGELAVWALGPLQVKEARRPLSAENRGNCDLMAWPPCGAPAVLTFIPSSFPLSISLSIRFLSSD